MYWSSINLLGRVGKTSLLLQYKNKSFNPDEVSTSNASFVEKIV